VNKSINCIHQKHPINWFAVQ